MSTNEFEVITDLLDYAPGATATFTVYGVGEGDAITFEVEHVSDAGDDGVFGTLDDTVVDLGGDGHDPWVVVDGGAGDLDGEANGVIVTEWYVNPDDSLNETFLLTATNFSTSEVASTGFTDGLAPGDSYAFGADGQADVDLTYSGQTDNFNGAWFTNDIFGAGTGVINSFLRTQASGNEDTEDGMNTDGTTNNDEKSGPFTRSVLLDDLPEFTSGDLPDLGLPSGTTYYELRLDINENSDKFNDQYISLDSMMLYVSLDPALEISSNLSGAPLDDTFVTGSETFLVWDLDMDPGNGIWGDGVSDTRDASTDAWVALNYDLQAGSGVGDIAYYIDVTTFDYAVNQLELITPGVDEPIYFYLVSSFGYQGDSGTAARVNADGDFIDEDGNVIEAPDGSEDAIWSTSDGFEEWSFVNTDANPWTISGTKYEDFNGNGSFDAGDSGVQNWTINLYLDGGDGVFDFGEIGSDDIVAASPILTDANGNYSFTGLVEGTYWVVEGSEDGWSNSSLTEIKVGDPTVDQGENFADIDFFNYRDISISGYKYLDVNGDGAHDADGVDNIGGSSDDEVGLQGWEIYLDLNNNNIFDGEDIKVTTDANGYYEFNGLAPGSYTVREILTGDYVQSFPTNTDGEWNLNNLTSGASETDKNFLNYLPATITGKKYYDQQDGGTTKDIVLAGWDVSLYKASADDGGDGDGTSGNNSLELSELDKDGDFIETVTTNASGVYTFDDLAPGSYFVVEELPSDWSATSTTQYKIVVESGETYGDDNDEPTDFTNYSSVTIGGTKYEDINGDGVRDVINDLPIDGATNAGEDAFTFKIWFEETGDGFDMDESVIDDTITQAADGTWSATLTKIGTYYIQELSKDGWSQSSPTSPDYYTVVVAYDPNNQILTATEDGDTPVDSLDFLNFEEMQVCGWKWADISDDGNWDENELGLNGVTIVLDVDEIWGNGNEVMTTVTAFNTEEGLNGYYCFDIEWEDFANKTGFAGDLYIYELEPNGFTQTFDGAYSFAVESGLTYEADYGVKEDGNFGNHMLDGANRTPGFWQSDLGKTFYDGTPDNEGDVGNSDGDDKDFVEEGWFDGDLLIEYGVGDPQKFLVWDDANGVDYSGTDIQLNFQQICKWVSGGDKGGGRDFITILQRDVAAVYLNTLNNAGIAEDGTPEIDPTIAEYYEDAIMFIQTVTGNKKVQKEAWSQYGQEAHTVLAAYNENGEALVEGAFVQIAMDGDDFSTEVVQSYLAAAEDYIA